VFAVIEGETVGYTRWWIVTLLAVSAVAGLAFIAAERRVRAPVIDLGFFRNRTFVGANLVAFVIFFGTFAIFFFTALYLYFIVGYSGYRTAEQFGAMTGAMILASVFTGRWVAATGPRMPITVGCVLGGAGILLTDHVLGQNVSFWNLAGTLVLTGLGFGIALVPVTSSVLSVVPAARSGMAASATNTSREVGAVFGVAVLGAVVDTQLTSHLVSELKVLGIPGTFQGLIQHAITAGGEGALTNQERQRAAQYVLTHPNVNVDKITHDATQAAYHAFFVGLDIALLLSGAMLLAAAIVAYFTVRSDPADDEELTV
jgi:predicted MFS family arabinose efflux permease